MENRSHALAAGFFTVLLVAALAVAGGWLGRSGDDYSRRLLVESRKSVAGLNPKAVVRYRGVDVGRVERIGFHPDNPQVIQIVLDVAPAAHVTTATYARLASLGITGIAYIELDDDGKTGPSLTPGADGAPPRLEMRASTLQEFGDAGQLLLVRVNEIAQRMSYLLNEENQVRLGHTFESIEKLTAQFVSFQDRVIPILDRMPKLMDRGDEVARRTEAAIAEMEQLSKEARVQLQALEEVRRSAEQVGHTSQDFHERTLPALTRLADRLGHAAEGLERALAAHTDEPQGVLFGPAPAEPGPGEPGWRAPRRGGKK